MISAGNQSDRNVKLVHRLAYCILFLLVTVFSLKMIFDKDLGFHLRAGQWMLENGQFMRHDVFTYTVTDHPVINLYWLYDLAMYGLYKIGGYPAISLGITAVILIVFGLMMHRMKSLQLSNVVIIGCLLVAVLIMEGRFNHRPEIFSWLYMSVLVWALDAHLYFSRRTLFLLPAIMLLWVNSHGLYMIGTGIIGAYTMTLWRQKKMNREAMRWIGLSFAAILVNPYFIDGVLYPFQLLTRFDPSNTFKNSIIELLSPWSKNIRVLTHIPLEVLYLYYALTILTMLTSLLRFRKIALHEWIILLAFLYLSCTQMRNIPFFVMYSVPLLAKNLRELLISFSGQLQRIERMAVILFAAIMLVIGVRIVTGAYYAADDRALSTGLGLQIPQETESYMISRNYKGKILNNVNSGNWLNWTVQQPSYIYSFLEVIGETIYKEYIQSTQRGGVQTLIRRYQPDLIVYDHTSELNWTIDLAGNPDWRLLFWDARTALFARNVTSGDTLNLSLVLKTYGLESVPTDEAKWSILKTSSPGKIEWWAKGLYASQPNSWPLLSFGNFALAVKQDSIAELAFLKFLRETHASKPVVYRDLGLTYYLKNEIKKAFYCYSRYLEYFPEDKNSAALFQQISTQLKTH
ncbi:hypothetical protein K1X84_10145 [bacterium]|nr:hypothetical protein [bacterium]